MNETAQSTQTTRARRRLLLLALLFVLPMVVAYGLYYGGWRPSTTGNHGELVQPARPIEDVALIQRDGTPMHFRDLRGKWTLLIFADGQCPNPCQQNLLKMTRVILAQGENAARVQSVLVSAEAEARDWLTSVAREYPELRVIIGPPQAVALLARQFAASPDDAAGSTHRIYLVDPLGNFMMRYEADADPNGLRKDLKRLLHVSRIG